MAKVYVVTKAFPMGDEVYVTVKPSFKAAEKVIRQDFPGARKDDHNPKKIGYLCKGYYSLADKIDGRKVDFLMFVTEEDL